MKFQEILRRRLRWPTTREVQQEAAVCVGLCVVVLALLLPAIGYARREYRDGLRRATLRNVKTELEHVFNDRQGFPLHPSGDLQWCGSTEDPEDWFFHEFLKTREQPFPLRDQASDAGYVYRYCPTALAEGSGTTPLASGFFLEARLENSHADSAGFNAEYNMFERTLVDGTRSLHRICGGNETQCGT
jgi:hypothetical protein